jgi:hypothetical protein
MRAMFDMYILVRTILALGDRSRSVVEHKDKIATLARLPGVKQLRMRPQT